MPLHLESQKTGFDVVSVAFNNEMVIDYQVSLFKKYLMDNFGYTVIDNSSDLDKQRRIRRVCVKHGVNYILPPRNPFHGELGSGSHGVVLNWSFKHFVTPRKPDFFGFIDHDVFPISETSILSNLSSSQIYGRIETKGDKWYLWPGFCFFAFPLLLAKKIDFMPEPGLDTGGKNWKPLYSKLDKNTIPNLTPKYVSLRPGENKQSDGYERMGAWIHTINASQWVHSPDKNQIIVNLLDQYL